MEIDYSNTWDKKCPQIKCRKDQCTGLTYVFIPATLGDDRKGSKVAPKNGAYCNAIVLYEADHAVYIYSKEGIPTKATSGDTFYNDILDRPFYNGEMMTSSTSIPKVPDAVSELTNDLNYQTKNDVDAAILVESTARELADQTLQGEIDTIVASSDVKDIVGTYAELQAYDTSTLGNNDIIKVLQDETHNDAETYYRWSTSTETFTYIGELGPFYTKSETNTLLSGKQDTLTAGTNITIAADNTISSKAQTIFYMNSSESGSTRHIYKKSDMTDPATSQEVFDANDLGQVILRISNSVTPESYSDAYLQNAYKATGDYQLLFLDEKTYRSFDVTDLSSSTFTYSSRVIQDQIVAGSGIAITNNVVSQLGYDVSSRTVFYLDGVNGSDSNDGLSTAKPLKTLHKALYKLNEGYSNVRFTFLTGGDYEVSSSSRGNISGKYIELRIDTGVSGVNFVLTGVDLLLNNCYINVSGENANHFTFSSGNASVRNLQMNSCYFQSAYTDYDNVRITANGSTVHIEQASSFCAIYGRGSNSRLTSVTVTESAYTNNSPIYFLEGGDIELGAITAAARTAALAYPFVKLESGSHLSINGTFTNNTTAGLSYTYGIYANASILQDVGTYYNQYNAIGSGVYASTATLIVRDNVSLPYTAGSNISISGSTISGNYQPFTGTDGNTAGTAGLVPAPAATDAGKILGADGTWKAIDHTFETFTFTLVDDTVVTKNIAVEA